MNINYYQKCEFFRMALKYILNRSQKEHKPSENHILNYINDFKKRYHILLTSHYKACLHQYSNQDNFIYKYCEMPIGNLNIEHAYSDYYQLKIKNSKVYINDYLCNIYLDRNSEQYRYLIIQDIYQSLIYLYDLLGLKLNTNIEVLSEHFNNRSGGEYIRNYIIYLNIPLLLKHCNKNFEQQLCSTICHELFHLLTFTKLYNFPIYINECFAYFISSIYTLEYNTYIKINPYNIETFNLKELSLYMYFISN